MGDHLKVDENKNQIIVALMYQFSKTQMEESKKVG